MKIIKSRWKNQFVTIEANSKFHNKVGSIFAKDKFFKLLHCYQEVAVSDLCEGYDSNQHRFDWYIDELNTVVELHGSQHYKMVNYGNISYDKAMSDFKKMKGRDRKKKAAAIEYGYEYVEIPYNHYKKLNGDLLRKLILERN